MTDNGDLRVTGATRLPEVEADAFSASGATTVEGDVHADSVDASGSLEVGGTVVTDSLDASGSTTIGGDLTADRADTSGSLRVDGAASIHDYVSSGSATLGSLSGDHLHTTGSLAADSIDVASIEGSGVIEAGQVRTDEFTFETKGDSEVGTLEADEIRVERSSGLLGLDIIGGSNGTLTADRIAGESVALEGVTADRVEGASVRIGPDCDIGTVDAEEVEVDESATVGEKR